MNTPAPTFSINARHQLCAGDGGPAVDHSLLTPNHGGNLLAPLFIVLHYTAGDSAEGAARWLCNATAKASAHLVVGRGGKTWQLCSFGTQTWHAGISSWKGRTSLNHSSIGIEMANRGFVKDLPRGANPSDYLTATHKAERTARHWERYLQTQVDTVAAICAALLAQYPSITEIVGHDDIAPARKTDPGPAWDWARFRDQVQQLHLLRPVKP